MSGNFLVRVTAADIGPPPLKAGMGADFDAGRHGALTIIDYANEEEGDRHPVAYLPPNLGFHVPEARALIAAWLSGDRQPWTEEQTAAFILAIRSRNPAVGAP